MTAEKSKKEAKKEEAKQPPDEKIQKIQEDKAELTASLQRLQADFENYKKQCDKEKREYKSIITSQFISQLLPVIDHFQLALKNTSNQKEFVKGIELIYSQLYGILEHYGMRPIDAAGKPFDPYKHEVLLQEESEKEDCVLEELQKGYMLNDKVLRLSKVKIGKKKKEAEHGNKGCVDP